MRSVRLKSKEGTVGFSHRPTPYEHHRYEFNLDNDFRNDVPEDVWEGLKNQYLDRSRDLKYGDAFIEL